MGPTCSGKTALSLELAGQLNGEIVACDSRTIYRYMDIGTAKPSQGERSLIQHHMIDVVSPDENYTVAQYKVEAAAAIESILVRQKTPIVCGGTGFYARALLEGLDIPPVAPNEELRAELKAAAESQGNQVLQERLRLLDPVSAERIAVNDLFRLVRALEVCLTLGRPFSQLARRVARPYRTIWLGLTAEVRSNLHAAIKLRFKEQMRSGLPAEVTAVVGRFGLTRALANTVNYKEFIPEVSRALLPDEIEELCIRHNCQLARRQLIWFRANPEIRWLAVDMLDSKQLSKQALDLIKSQQD